MNTTKRTWDFEAIRPVGDRHQLIFRTPILEGDSSHSIATEAYQLLNPPARLDAPVSPSAARVGEEPAPPWRVLAKANGYCAEGFPPLWWTWNRVKKRFIPTDPWFGDREPTEITVIENPYNDAEAVEIVAASLRAGMGEGE